MTTESTQRFVPIHGPAPEFACYGLYATRHAGANSSSPKNTKAKHWIRIDGAVLYLHPTKDDVATVAVGLQTSLFAINQVSSSGCEFSINYKEIDHFFEMESQTDFDDIVTTISKAQQWKLENYYGIFNIIGKGGFATVHGGYDKKSNEKVAIKILHKANFVGREVAMLIAEYEAAKKLCHPHIQKIRDIFNGDTTLAIVMDLMPGGSLSEIVVRSLERSISEADIKVILFETLLALRYMHSIGVAHRDIKPDNIMLKDRNFPFKTKLIDFGFCCWYDKDQYYDNPLQNKLGTKSFCAPEILVSNKSKYTPQVDLFGLGVSMYFALEGDLPFTGKTDEAISEAIYIGVDFHRSQNLTKISPEAKSIMKSLLHPNALNRLSADAAYVHPWFAEERQKRNKENDIAPVDESLSRLGSLFYVKIFQIKLEHVKLAGTKPKLLSRFAAGALSDGNFAEKSSLSKSAKAFEGLEGLLKRSKSADDEQEGLRRGKSMTVTVGFGKLSSARLPNNKRRTVAVRKQKVQFEVGIGSPSHQKNTTLSPNSPGLLSKVDPRLSMRGRQASNASKKSLGDIGSPTQQTDPVSSTQQANAAMALNAAMSPNTVMSPNIVMSPNASGILSTGNFVSRSILGHKTRKVSQQRLDAIQEISVEMSTISGNEPVSPSLEADKSKRSSATTDIVKPDDKPGLVRPSQKAKTPAPLALDNMTSPPQELKTPKTPKSGKLGFFKFMKKKNEKGDHG